MLKKSIGRSFFTQVCFVENDSTQINIMREIFSGVAICICAIYAVKTLKTNIAREMVKMLEKEMLLTPFRRIMYSIMEASYILNEANFIKLCSKTLCLYYCKNWGSIPELWVSAFRAELRTNGDQTTKRIERFFRTIKWFLRSSGKSAEKHHGLLECMKLVVQVLDNEVQRSSFMN